MKVNSLDAKIEFTFAEIGREKVVLYLRWLIRDKWAQFERMFFAFFWPILTTKVSNESWERVLSNDIGLHVDL